MRSAENAAIDAGTGVDELMLRAGSAMFAAIAGQLGELSGKSATVLAGPGSNGGDGVIVAVRLAEAGCRVQLICSRVREDAAAASSANTAIELIPYAPGSVRRSVGDSDLVVDALLGIGSAPPLRGSVARMLGEIGSTLAPRIALDMPSGIDPQTGAADPAAFPADLTICAGPCKLGVLQFPARPHAGRILATDIGLGHPGSGHVLDADVAAGLLPRRPSDAHKGTFGRVLAIAGSAQYRGAAGLVCGGALRGGAGYVELAAPEPVVAAVAAHLLGPTFTVLDGAAGELRPNAIGILKPAAERAAVIAAGPGLGTGTGPDRVVKWLTSPDGPDRPIILDADALTLISPLRRPVAPNAAGNVVLTPHPGEMARLLGIDRGRVMADRLAAARAAAERAGAVVVHKGAGTIVALPDGRYGICPLASPGLASAGTGDVLTGLIAALLGSGMAAWDAARLGVYLHARSGQLAAAEIAVAGVLAADLAPLIPLTWAELESGRPRPIGLGC
jgi:NAD(P)H-hydrate epimerase